MLRKLFEKVAAFTIQAALPHMRPPRFIFDRVGKAPYLSRYYLKGRPKMEDGSDPFDDTGSPRKGIIWNDGLGIYLHKFHQSDDDEELHNHPWKWALSLILVGGYSEERRVPHNRVVRDYFFPGSFNYITKDDFHRVDLLDKEAWSLFITGPKFKSWGFWNRYNYEFTPWKEFIARRREHGQDSDS